MKLLFSGDINFRGLDGLDYVRSQEMVADILPYVESVDYTVYNIECAMGNVAEHKPIEKGAPCLMSAPENICFLQAMRTDAVTLANNHVGDFGDSGTIATVELFEKNGIQYAGAGRNLEDAYRAIRFEKNGESVSILSVCEHETGLAGRNVAGAAGYNERLLLRRIREEKMRSDYVVVVFHGGNEFNPFPSPDTVDRYRFVCDMGADALIGGHPHCVQGYEIYDGKPIVYSLGNFMFKSGAERQVPEQWYHGYLAILNLGENSKLEIVPYSFDDRLTKISVRTGEEREKMLAYIDEISAVIGQPELLENYFMGWAWLMRTDAARFKMPDDFDKLEQYNASTHLNLAICDAHISLRKMLIKTILNGKIVEAMEWAEKVQAYKKMP